MVQAVENWAVVEGPVQAIRASQAGPDYIEVDVAVERTEPVEGFPNLFAEAENTVVPVTIRRDAIDKLGLSVGDRIRLQARRASPFSAFAKPDEIGLAPAEQETASLEPAAETPPPQDREAES